MVAIGGFLSASLHSLPASAETEWQPLFNEESSTVIIASDESAVLSQSQAQDWCQKLFTALSRPSDYTYAYKQMIKGNCAHQQFEKSNLGSRVKYGKTGAATVPDGTKYVIKELKPSKKQAQAAANRTSRITGVWLADVPAIEGEWPVPTPDSLEIMKRQEERGGYGTEPPVIT